MTAVTSTTTLKLPAPLKKRIASLAAQAGTTPHALMVTALENHVAREERWEEFLHEAAESDRGADAGDEVYAAADVHAWLEKIARGKPARRPRPWQR
jgi:predicted transcriptional regulator